MSQDTLRAHVRLWGHEVQLLDPRQRFMVGDEIYSYAYQRQLVGMVAVRACS